MTHYALDVPLLVWLLVEGACGVVAGWMARAALETRRRRQRASALRALLHRAGQR